MAGSEHLLQGRSGCGSVTGSWPASVTHVEPGTDPWPHEHQNWTARPCGCQCDTHLSRVAHRVPPFVETIISNLRIIHPAKIKTHLNLRLWHINLIFCCFVGVLYYRFDLVLWIIHQYLVFFLFCAVCIIVGDTFAVFRQPFWLVDFVWQKSKLVFVCSQSRARLQCCNSFRSPVYHLIVWIHVARIRIIKEIFSYNFSSVRSGAAAIDLFQ